MRTAFFLNGKHVSCGNQNRLPPLSLTQTARPTRAQPSKAGALGGRQLDGGLPQGAGPVSWPDEADYSKRLISRGMPRLNSWSRP